MDIKSDLNIQIQKLDEILSLGNDGLLKSERMYETIHSVEDHLKEISNQFDERSRLSIEKTIPMWRNVPKTGIFVQFGEVVKRVSPLKTLLAELLVKQSPQSKVNIKSEIVINSGQPYNGRLYLRQIFNEANLSLFIRDSYLRPEVLDILSEYLLDKNGLSVKVLMGENNRLPALRASYLAFQKQYPNKIEARYSPKGQSDDHPRYIIVDDQLVFNPDHSLDQWGQKTVNIHQMTEVAEIEKVKNNLISEWDSATVI